MSLRSKHDKEKDENNDEGFFSHWVKRLFGGGNAGKITLGLGVSALGTVGAYYYLNSKYPLPALFNAPTPIAIVPEVVNTTNIAVPATILAGAAVATAGAATYFRQWINQEYQRIKDGFANLENEKKVVSDQYKQFDSLIAGEVGKEKLRLNVQHEMARTMVHRLDGDRKAFDSHMHEQFEAGINVNKKRMNAIEATERELKREIARFDSERKRVRDFERALEQERMRLNALEIHLKDVDNRRRATYNLSERHLVVTSRLNAESSAAQLSRISERNNLLNRRLSRRDITIKTLEAAAEKQRRDLSDGLKELESRALQLDARQAKLNEAIRVWEESAAGASQIQDLNIQREDLDRRERVLDTERKILDRDEQVRDASLIEMDRKMHLIKMKEDELNARQKALESLIVQHAELTLEGRRASGSRGSSSNSSPSKQQHSVL